jgi:SagB-type dehydrogenase family enzyme
MIENLSKDRGKVIDVWIYSPQLKEYEGKRRELLLALLLHVELIDALDDILLNGATIEELEGLLSERIDLAAIFYLVESLIAHGILQHHLRSEGISVIGFEKTICHFNAKPPLNCSLTYNINRFVYIKFENNLLVIESPGSSCRVMLYDARYFNILYSFANPLHPMEIFNLYQWSNDIVVYKIIELLASSGIIQPIEVNDDLVHWEFHDFLFFHFTRMKRNDRKYGGTYRLQSQMSPDLAIKRVEWKVAKKLAAPGENIFKETLFHNVLNNRTSKRNQNNSVITIQQLEALLFTAIKVKKENNVAENRLYETTVRSYPGAGACYELEIYIAVNNCVGLNKGLYYYNPLKHELCTIPADSVAINRLITSSAKAMGANNIPQILMVISARFLRVMWKYESIAYSLILKDVGVLMQTIALVATSLNLSACPIGNGNTSDFEAATGLNPLLEGSVGEIIICG